MNHHPLVSVIIIFFNAEEFIREAIESVFEQTYSNWELLLVDDGSTDGSTEVACQYVENNPGKVHYLAHPMHENRGMSASRNLGIHAAHGNYIAFLDADDLWFSNTLEDQIDILESQQEAALVYGPIQYWHSWTGRPEDIRRDYVEKLGVPANRIIRPPELFPLFLRDKAAVPSGIMVRRQVCEQVGGFEEAFRGEYEDQVFCAKVCLQASVFASNQCWYRYRQHEDSCVSVGLRTGETDSARRFFLNWLTGFLTDQKVKDRRVWRAVLIESWHYNHPRAFRLFQQGVQFVTQLMNS